MNLSEIGIPLENLPGTGPATAKLFARLNIFTVGDLLSAYPKNYEDKTRRVPLRDFNSSKVNCLCIVKAHEWFGYGAMKTLKICITDGQVTAFLVAFNRPFLQKNLPVGSVINVCGKFEVKYSELQSTSFEAEKIKDEATIDELEELSKKPLSTDGIFPVYALTEGLTQKTYSKTVKNALKLYSKTISNELPDSVIQNRKLLQKSQAVELIHFPNNFTELEEARKTIIYEELYNFEYKLAKRSLYHRGKLPGIEAIPEATPYFSTPDSTSSPNLDVFKESLSPRQKKLLESLPFELTAGQKTAISQINSDIDLSQKECNDMLTDREKLERNPFSMQRLLQGDVGSGKTLVSFFAVLRTIDWGGQCALLAPTEILARQHAENAGKLLEKLNVRTAFLTGNVKSKGRENLLNALKNGEIDLVVGTHALFSTNVQYKKLALAIIDEQHRFGVQQRESIMEKGRISFRELSHSTDLLMMSATPIPQTLALTAFGDLDISTITTMPNGRKQIKTYLSVMGNEANPYEAVRKELLNGHQAYFVYPRIGESEGNSFTDLQNDSSSLKSAEEMYQFLSKNVYPQFKCALIHGKTDDEEQHRILSDFNSGKIQVLVATTVVEVGVDVPNANCIVIEHAERFGLAELHQLRGRVGRSSLQSYCFLIYSKDITQDGKDRLKALHSTTDGFKISEEDLRLRGPGEVNGTMQSGYLSLGLADLVRDRELLKLARYDAFSQFN